MILTMLAEINKQDVTEIVSRDLLSNIILSIR